LDSPMRGLRLVERAFRISPTVMPERWIPR